MDEEALLRVGLSRVKNTLMFSPVNLAPSAMVWPMPRCVCRSGSHGPGTGRGIGPGNGRGRSWAASSLRAALRGLRTPAMGAIAPDGPRHGLAAHTQLVPRRGPHVPPGAGPSFAGRWTKTRIPWRCPQALLGNSPGASAQVSALARAWRAGLAWPAPSSSVNQAEPSAFRAWSWRLNSSSLRRALA